MSQTTNACGIPADGFDSYDDAIQVTLSRKQAVAEINKHNCHVDEFFSDVGEKESYTGKEVLDWLGY